MTSLLVPAQAPDRDGCVMRVTPESAAWRYVGFEVYRIAAGARLRRELAGRETCVVVLGGTCDIRSEAGEWMRLGTRATPFDGPPAGAYLPPGTAFEIAAGSAPVEIALGHAPAQRGASARAIGPEDARLEVRGSGAMERRIHHILMEDAAAESLLVTEVVTPGGHWSSYPPHKHDTNDPPRETALEETYYHRLRDERGFALQRVYTADRTLDESLSVRNGECVLVPRGYHTVSAPPGYELYYLNVMAGPVRQWKVTFDPDHRRLMG
ncbi:MAG TPA: 5-deoxy-glucuronate isomerase [Candidatus Limnocylindria bacterium]|nr:5-deoxy-glucuronate isomerase [Candidatus Limnocylindria bacterium]